MEKRRVGAIKKERVGEVRKGENVAGEMKEEEELEELRMVDDTTGCCWFLTSVSFPVNTSRLRWWSGW